MFAYYSFIMLTDNVEPDELAAMRLSGDLALVESGITGLGKLDLQSPIFTRPGADDAEPLIRRVRVSTHGQDVNVPVAHPRDLRPSSSPPKVTYDVSPFMNISRIHSRRIWSHHRTSFWITRRWVPLSMFLRSRQNLLMAHHIGDDALIEVIKGAGRQSNLCKVGP